MSNIRYFSRGEVKVTIDGVEMESMGNAEILEDFKAAIREGIRDRRRYIEPVPEVLSAALRDLYASDMTGAEKVAAMQALMRTTDTNVCVECGGDGWVAEVVNQSIGNPYGEQEQAECESCNGTGSRFPTGHWG